VRGIAALALLASLPLCACAPKPPAAAPRPLALDCSQPFDAQAARLIAQPHLVAAPKEPGEPYAFYSTQDGKASYVITQKGAPGHPAILMQTTDGRAERTTGCPYGDAKGYAKVFAYVDGLKAVTHR
jgi:hypothetical protein